MGGGGWERARRGRRARVSSTPDQSMYSQPALPVSQIPVPIHVFRQKVLQPSLSNPLSAFRRGPASTLPASRHRRCIVLRRHPRVTRISPALGSTTYRLGRTAEATCQSSANCHRDLEQSQHRKLPAAYAAKMRTRYQTPPHGHCMIVAPAPAVTTTSRSSYHARNEPKASTQDALVLIARELRTVDITPTTEPRSIKLYSLWDLLSAENCFLALCPHLFECACRRCKHQPSFAA